MSIIGVVVTLAGCGSTDKDRAVSGGGIGAGLGAATGLVIGGPFAGIVLGGVFGTATGLVTDESTIDLGEPVWKDGRKASEQPGDRADRDGHTQSADVQRNQDLDPEGFDRGFEILE